MGNSLRQRNKQSLNTKKENIDYELEVQRISKQLENDEKVKNMKKIIEMRKTCLYRDLTDPIFIYDQVQTSMIYRTGGIQNNYIVDQYCEYRFNCNECDRCKECKRIWDQIEQKDDYIYPYIGDLIVRYFSGKDTYLLDFLKEFDTFYKNKIMFISKNIINYASICEQVYFSIINKEETRDFEDCKIGSLKYHNFSSYWTIEKSLQLFEFILNNRLFKNENFNIWTLNQKYKNYQVISAYTIIFELVKMDRNNLKLIKDCFDRLNVKIGSELFLRFFNMIKDKKDTENNLLICNIIKTLVSSPYDQVIMYACDNLFNFKKVFRLFYDSTVNIKTIDKCFANSCRICSSNAEFLCKQKFSDRKYKIYFSSIGTISTYRIKYL